jgi:hypothetical protein
LPHRPRAASKPGEPMTVRFSLQKWGKDSIMTRMPTLIMRVSAFGEYLY